MRIPLILLIAFVGSVLGGCASSSDQPHAHLIEGQVLAADTGQPLSRASLSVESDGGSVLFWPVPVSRIEPTTGSWGMQTDEEGRFSMTVSLYQEITITVGKDPYFGKFRWAGVQPSDRMDQLVLRVGKK